jgi:hypothetical protein
MQDYMLVALFMKEFQETDVTNNSKYIATTLLAHGCLFAVIGRRTGSVATCCAMDAQHNSVGADFEASNVIFVFRMDSCGRIVIASLFC